MRAGRHHARTVSWAYVDPSGWVQVPHEQRLAATRFLFAEVVPID